MIKQELRKKYKILRNDLTNDDVDTLSLAVANNLLKLDIWNFDFYHIFLAIKEYKEVNTEFILNILSGKDKNCVISSSDFKSLKMTHYLLTDNTRIKKNKYNIPEPVDGIEIASQRIEIVFVPLLAYDISGSRVGYGKGFYDLFLSECNPETLKIGLSLFEAEPIISDSHDKDVKLDYCVNPFEIHAF